MKLKKTIAMILATVTAFSLLATGCGSKQEAPAKEPEKTVEETPAETPDKEPETEEVITIKYPTYRVGTQGSAGSEAQLVAEFNEQYAGKYHVEIEEIPSQEAYTEKMKILASTNALPDVVEGFEGIYDLAIANGQAVPLNEYIDNDEQYKKEVGELALTANVVDGKIMSIPNQCVAVPYFYNKEHFEKAGITPAKTWEEFDANVEALADAGFIPMSLMTGENGWSTNLLLAAYVGSQNDTSNAFMNEKDPTDYNVPELEEGLEKIAGYLKNYTTPDALGSGYAVMENHFLNGETSMLFNGVWVCGAFNNSDMRENIGVALFPNDTGIVNYERGYMVCKQQGDTDGKRAEAAATFLKFKTNAHAQELMLAEGTAPLTAQVKMSDEAKAANPLLDEALTLVLGASRQCGQLNYKWQAEVADELVKNYVNLVDGSKTPAELCEKLTELAK